MDNFLLHASKHSPVDKIEEEITFALIHEHLYLAESDDKRDNKFAAADTLYISCHGGGYSSSLSAITVSVSATSDAVICLIFTSDLFLPNDPLLIYDMVD